MAGNRAEAEPPPSGIGWGTAARIVEIGAAGIREDASAVGVDVRGVPVCRGGALLGRKFIVGQEFLQELEHLVGRVDINIVEPQRVSIAGAQQCAAVAGARCPLRRNRPQVDGVEAKAVCPRTDICEVASIGTSGFAPSLGNTWPLGIILTTRTDA